MWIKYEEEQLGEILQKKQDSYSRVDLETVGVTGFWAFVGSLVVGIGLGVSTNLAAFFGFDSLVNQLFLVLVLFVVFEIILVGSVRIDRLVFETKDLNKQRKFIYEKQIRNSQKLCTLCQRVFESEAVNCTECGRSLVSTVGYHWVDEQSK